MTHEPLLLKTQRCFSGSRSERVEVGIRQPKYDDAVRDRGRALDANLVIDFVTLPRLEAPLFCPACGIQCVQIRIPTPDEQRSVRQCGRGKHHVTGFKFPFHGSRCGFERVHISVARAEIHSTAPETIGDDK